MAELLKGKPVVDSIAEEVSRRVSALESRGTVPTLALLRMGERPDDLSYERSAMKRAETLGLAVRQIILDEMAPQSEVEAAIEKINADTTIHGCLMFRPLPKHIKEQEVCDTLAVEKDIDGISSLSLASVFMDGNKGYAPCTASACEKVLDYYNVPVSGKHIVVVGRSLVIGKPVAMILLRRHATVTLCHSRTEDIAATMRSADIVICATGRARMFGAECFTQGQTVLDVGINFDESGTMCGDVDFASVEPLVGAITPVPGGIGSVTTVTLMEHVVRAAERELRD